MRAIRVGLAGPHEPRVVALLDLRFTVMSRPLQTFHRTPLLWASETLVTGGWVACYPSWQNLLLEGWGSGDQTVPQPWSA